LSVDKPKQELDAMSQPIESLQTIDTKSLEMITGGGSQNGADYQCGPYNLELRGPDQAALFRNGQLLQRWNSEASTPTFLDKKGNMSLVRNQQAFRCRPLSSGR
jgi:hypothetical protein